MSELDYAVTLADKVLDRHIDPDADLAVLARQFLRARETLAAAEKRIAETERDLGQALLRQDDEIDHLKARVTELSGKLEQATDQIGSQHSHLQKAVQRIAELERLLVICARQSQGDEGAIPDMVAAAIGDAEFERLWDSLDKEGA